MYVLQKHLPTRAEEGNYTTKGKILSLEAHETKKKKGFSPEKKFCALWTAKLHYPKKKKKRKKTVALDYTQFLLNYLLQVEVKLYKSSWIPLPSPAIVMYIIIPR